MAAMGGLGWNQPPPQFAGGPMNNSSSNNGRTINASGAAAEGPAPINLRLLLSGDEVKYLFGVDEQLLGQLRQQTGALLTLTEPGAHERVLTITGPLDTVFKAFSLVCRKMWEFVSSLSDPSNPRSLVLRLAVPAPQCGSIIGKAGAKIKEIRDLSGADMNVGQESLPESTERTVEIIGTGEACLQSTYQVCTVLQDVPVKGDVIPYVPRSLIKDLWKPIVLAGDRAYTIENGMAVLATPDRLRTELEQMMGIQLGPLGGGGPEYMNPIALLAAMATPNRLMGGAGGAQEVFKEMRIENEVAGSVIGRSGSKVAEIRKISGAFVNVNTEDEVTEQGERIVVIRGSPEAVLLAQFLVQSTIDLFRRDRSMGGGGGGGGGDFFPGGGMMMNMPPLPGKEGAGFDFSDQMVDPAGHRGFVFGRGGGGGGGPPPYGRGGSGRGGGGPPVAVPFGRGGGSGGRGSPMGGPIGMRGKGRRH